jgi:hypothetical protein
MKITEVTSTFSFTKNLGNYQSLKAEATVTAALEPGEKVEDVFAKSFDLAKDQVRTQVKTGEVK